MAMILSFPNPSRSYDAARHRVRFWAYDAALEICFFVEEEALCSADAEMPRSEGTVLDSFDLHRNKIFKAADRIYSRHSRDAYTLTASDLQ